MTGLLAIALLAAVVGVLVFASSAERRVAAAQARADALAARNLRLERAVGVAEQSLRSLATDTRLDAGMAVQIDSALADLRRAAGEGDPGIGRR
ncbi:MAG TPA: hypothetical protein VK894_09595 [Jiangellales bacterium]|nr:hypothetical protein [Jiangellales bacterium]